MFHYSPEFEPRPDSPVDRVVMESNWSESLGCLDTELRSETEEIIFMLLYDFMLAKCCCVTCGDQELLILSVIHS